MTPLAKVSALVGAGFVSLLVAIVIFIRQRRILEVVPSSNFTVQLPTKWDDNEITKMLQRHQEQPAVLAHIVSSIKSRMILNQDLKTAQRRLQHIASVIEVFKLGREMQGIPVCSPSSKLTSTWDALGRQSSIWPVPARFQQ